MNFRLRVGSSADAEACGMICYEAFKAISEHHNFPPDFPSAEAACGLLSSLFSLPNVYSVVAEMEGRIVGSNFLWEDTTVAGVGPITIAPHIQNSTLGRCLMKDVLERARQQRFAGVRLVQAAFHNRSLALYAKLGFDVQEPLANFQGQALRLEIPGYTVRLAARTSHRGAHDINEPRSLQPALRRVPAFNSLLRLRRTAVGLQV
jgi:predicted N-acetyltransferase YhbS